VRRDKDRQRTDVEEDAHLGDVVDDAIDDFTLEGLHHDRRVLALELGLAGPRKDLACTDVDDGKDGDDVATRCAKRRGKHVSKSARKGMGTRCARELGEGRVQIKSMVS
jgi:hypothetical protein